MSVFLDLSNVKDQKSGPLEPGTYLTQVESADLKDTKSGTGQYIEIMLKVSEGDNVGRKIRHKFNVKNASETAQDIGLSQLKTFLICAGRSGDVLESVDMLPGLKVQVVTRLKKDMHGMAYPEVKYFQTPVAKAEAGGF